MTTNPPPTDTDLMGLADELLAHVAKGGPHEWGYRDLTDGTFIEDDWPFRAAEALPHLANLLARQHAAMGDVMILRRLSSSPHQREMADNAIAVWREVEAFLRTPSPVADEALVEQVAKAIYESQFVGEWTGGRGAEAELFRQSARAALQQVQPLIERVKERCADVADEYSANVANAIRRIDVGVETVG